MSRFSAIDDARREAPLHYWQRANDARYAAWVLWKLSKADDPPDATEISYNGWEPSALGDAWRRERSIALELILKALIAQRAETNTFKGPVPMTHNTHQLWGTAGLPRPSNEDRYRLLRTWQLLQWAGRYAAPRKGDEGQRGDIIASLPNPTGRPAIVVHPRFDWDEFDSLYQRADQALWAEREKLPHE